MQLDFKFYLFGFVITLLVLGFFLLLLTTLFSKKQQKSRAEKLKMQNEFQQSLIEAQVQTQEQTLTTISQEIHDNVGQVLSLAKLNLNMLNTDQMEGAVREKLGNTTALITKAIDDLRTLSKSLNGEMFVDVGLQEAVKREVTVLQDGGFIEGEYFSSGKAFSLPRESEVVIYRMIQECIQNAIKHARAKKVTITLVFNEPHLQVIVADDGKGFSESAMPSSKSGLGLRNMKSRSAYIGAKLSINSAPEKGTQINIYYTLK